MKLSLSEFRAWSNKCVTLLGMSGVGKTRLSCLLRKQHWFHYSNDYRIGTRYLDEPILDNIKRQAMSVPFLRDLLRSDSIHIQNNITVDNLQPVSSFLGKLGNPELGGLGLTEFKLRQRLHRDAEIAAIMDVPGFKKKAREIYAYEHFVNDAGGSLCELDSREVMDVLTEHSLILYIEATEEDHKQLVKRAEQSPKPLYYREAFLDEHLREYMQTFDLPYVAMIDPDNFARWMFPRLFYSRIPRYEAIAEKRGYTVTSAEVGAVRDEIDFADLLERAIVRDPA